MEFGFNLAWLILSLALSAAWAWFANRSSSHHTYRTTFLALVILIALLFPVVSISDDLHEDQNKITSEEPRNKEDLHPHFEAARLQIDHVPLALEAALTSALPAIYVGRQEEVREHFTVLRSVRAGFPPTVHDLPP